MRDLNSIMTKEEFEEAVELAKEGTVQSCNGATDAIQRSLDAIIDADPQEQNEAVREAYRVYREYLSALPVEEADAGGSAALYNGEI